MRIIRYIFGWIVFLEQFLGIGGFFYFAATKNPGLALLITGQYLFVMGIAIFSNKRKIGISLTITGALIIGIGSLLKWGYILNLDYKKLVSEIIVWGVIISFISFGLGCLLRPIYLKRKWKSHTLKISAEVIDYETSFDEGCKTYCPIYQYNYNNQEYKYSDNLYTNIGVPQKGSKIDMYINPNDARDAFVPSSKTIDIVYMFFGIMFFSLGIFVLVLVIFVY